MIPQISCSPTEFPATDRPSSAFLDAFDRNWANSVSRAPDSDLYFRFDRSRVGEFGKLLAVKGYSGSGAVLAIGAHRGFASISDLTRHALLRAACGGPADGRSDVYSRPSPLGLRVADRVARELVGALSSTMLPTAELVTSTARLGEHVFPSAPALACDIGIEWNGRPVGAALLCLPLRGLSEIEQRAGVPSENREWRKRLERVLATVRVPVRCVLARPTLSAGRVANLAPGAVLPIPALSDVSLVAAGYKIATGQAEIRDGDAVIRIKHKEMSA